MIGSRIGRYRVLAPLGEGGMATVWQARDELLGHIVALKALAPALAGSTEARRRFRHEAEIASQLDHPGIVAVHDSGESDGATWIAMTLVEGETLGERIARSLIPVDEVLGIVSAAAAALGHAHVRGVIHRDVTSRNIMLARDGRVLVLDFGLALAQGISRVSSSSTRVGTAAYMAPEILLGETADPRSDLYGLGMVLYEALTGSVAFHADRFEALQYAALNQPVRPPSERRAEVPAALDLIVLKALERDPQRRHQNADELLAELRACGAGAGAARAEAAPAAGTMAERLAAGRGPLYLVIVPFVDRSHDPDLDGARARIAHGLHETLSASLAEARRIHVVPFEPGAASDSDRRALARRLGANLVLEGMIRASASQVRVTFSLTDPETGERIGGGAVHGSRSDPFALEDQLVARARAALGSEAGGGREGRKPPARDPAAHEHFLQALQHLRRADHEPSVDAAIALLSRLIATEGERAPFHAALARGYLAKFQLTRQHAWQSRAASEADRAVALAPDSPETLVALAETRAAAGQEDAALAEFERALALQPDLFEARLGMAGVLESLRRSAEAETACREAIAQRPEDWRGYHQLGRLYFRQGQYARAIEPWRRVVQLTPDNTRASSNLGSAYFHMDRFDDAIAAYRHSLGIQPNPLAYTSLGTVLFYLERYEEAADAFEKAVLLRDSDPVMWGNLGNACWFIPGRRARAEEAVTRAIGLMRERVERQPTDADAWSRLGGWLGNLERNDEAVSAMKRAQELAPDDVHVMVNAGQLYAQIGERDCALHWLEQAVLHGYGAEALARSPLLSSLRGEPRFERILAASPRPSWPRP